jgi:haloacetate dehalogenase
MWTDFQPLTLQRDGVTLFARQGGPSDSGRPPLLLLHGHPQTMAMWHRVAPALARKRRVVLMDLRGYGDSGRPVAGEASAAYAKREMALDAVALMRSLGHERFAVLAHDRGARVAHRLALDHPQAVDRLMLLDIAPTLAMYEGTTEAFARAYWHWFFLIQPAPLPERLIEADPIAYLRDGMGRRGGGFFAPEAWAEYERCIAKPATAAAICADYRHRPGPRPGRPRCRPARQPAAAGAVGRERRRRPLL